jgi:hypothetical protein
VHGEAVLATQLGERLDGAAAAHAEAEVGADHDDASVQRVDEDAPHELLGGLLAERAVEGQHDGRVDTGLAEALDLLCVAEERRRAGFGPEETERVPVEGDDRGGQPLASGYGPQVADDAAVAGVHTVELADGDGARTEVGRHGREAVVEAHGHATAVSASARTGRRARSHSMPSTGSTRGTKP